MKGLKFLLATITLVVICSRCTENDNVEPNPIPSDSLDAPLTDEQAAFLETVKDTVFRLEDIILEDGQDVRSFLETNDPDFLQAYPSGRVGKTTALPPRQQKNMFLSRMMAMGTFLVDRTKHVYAAAGTDKPNQFGLAYSWGSKDYNIRQTPPGSGAECKDLKIHGLDCSGMLWAMTQAAKLTVVPKYNFYVEYISDADKWTRAFKASDDYKDLKMKNMGKLLPGAMKNGDIILWGGHVGIYLYGWFYQSNGSKLKPGCLNNLNIDKGPRCISLTEVVGWPGLGNYKVFRTMADLKFRVEVKYRSTQAIYPGVLLKDSSSMKVEVKDDVVTCSDFTNAFAKIIPSSVTENGCTVKWVVEGYSGPFTIASCTGLVSEATGGESILKLVVGGTSHTAAFTSDCPPSPTSSTPPGSGPLFLPVLEFNLDDNIPTYKDPSGNLLAKAIPID